MPGLNVIDVSKRGPMVGDMYVTVFRTNNSLFHNIYQGKLFTNYHIFVVREID